MAIGFGIASRNWWRAQFSGGIVPSFALNFATIATDFTFTRNSFATRVNENGLIETVTDEGSELRTDGVISNLGGGSFTFTANGVHGVSDGTSGSALRPRLLWGSLTVGKQYRIVGTPTINSGSTNYAFYDGTAYIKNQVAVEAFDITFTCGGANVFFTNDGTQAFDIDWDLSLKEQNIEDDVPRIDYSSGEGAFLLEPASTNLYLNSETLSTQDVTTSASTYTISFRGTGSVSLSGSGSGTLVGTGALDLVSLTFTATAGTLTSTVSGSVKYSNLENLGYATSWIPTDGIIATIVKKVFCILKVAL